MLLFCNLRKSYPGNASGLFDLVDVDNEGLITKAEFGNMTQDSALESISIFLVSMRPALERARSWAPLAIPQTKLG